MVTTSQIKKIHTLKTVIGLDNDSYLEMLKSFQVLSSKQLTDAEADIIIECLERDAISMNKWKKYPKKYSDLNRSEEMASPAQLRMIEGIWGDIVVLKPDKYTKKNLRGFLITNFKIFDVMFLTRNRASDVINGLKNMRANIKKSVAAL